MPSASSLLVLKLRRTGEAVGQASFFQRLFGIIAGGDIKARTKDIARLRGELGDDQVADALVQCVALKAP